MIEYASDKCMTTQILP